MKFPSIIITLIIAFTSAGCTSNGQASSRHEIDAKVRSALVTFGETVGGGDALVQKAEAVLIFPEVVKGGIGVGGEYGEGALMIDGRTIDYYNIASASIGFQLGVQVKSQILIFLEPTALENFRRSNGWEAGIDGSVALVTVGAGGQIDTNNVQQPIIGFVFSNKGLMYNLTLEGSKISKIEK
jgi:lipid-binding SYLF domain-containing protein